MANIVNALMSLKPGAEFTMTDEDYSTIQWIVIEGTAPTEKQINDEIKRLTQLEATAEADRLAARSALLERLNITEEEARLLLG